MNTNKIELSMKELENVNGGFDLWEGLSYVTIFAASGAVIGGGISSSVPVVGTVAGGILGGAIGGAIGSGVAIVKCITED